jgi:hypothetical protein
VVESKDERRATITKGGASTVQDHVLTRSCPVPLLPQGDPQFLSWNRAGATH